MGRTIKHEEWGRDHSPAGKNDWILISPMASPAQAEQLRRMGYKIIARRTSMDPTKRPPDPREKMALSLLRRERAKVVFERWRKRGKKATDAVVKAGAWIVKRTT